MLFGRKCHTPTCWLESGEKQLASSEMKITEDKVRIARDNLRVARERKKTYSDRKYIPKTFEGAKKVMLKVAPWKGIIRFKKRGKMRPQYIGPLVLECIGDQVYRLVLPPDFEGIHDLFHMCYLRKYVAEEPNILPSDELRVD